MLNSGTQIVTLRDGNCRGDRTRGAKVSHSATDRSRNSRGDHASPQPGGGAKTRTET